MNHEELFVKTFIQADKQSRYLELLANPKRRNTFLHRFAHHLDYIPSFAIKIPPARQTSEQIYELLKKRGASDACHIMSEYSEIDGKDISLNEALDQVVGMSLGTVISCIPGRLAYYEAEDVGDRFILAK
jgi:hypothetical protein